MTAQAPVSNWAWTADAYFPATAAPQTPCEEQQYWDLPHKFFSTEWQSYRWGSLALPDDDMEACSFTPLHSCCSLCTSAVVEMATAPSLQLTCNPVHWLQGPPAPVLHHRRHLRGLRALQ